MKSGWKIEDTGKGSPAPVGFYLFGYNYKKFSETLLKSIKDEESDKLKYATMALYLGKMGHKEEAQILRQISDDEAKHEALIIKIQKSLNM